MFDSGKNCLYIVYKHCLQTAVCKQFLNQNHCQNSQSLIRNLGNGCVLSPRETCFRVFIAAKAVFLEISPQNWKLTPRLNKRQVRPEWGFLFRELRMYPSLGGGVAAGLEFTAPPALHTTMMAASSSTTGMGGGDNSVRVRVEISSEYRSDPPVRGAPRE